MSFKQLVPVCLVLGLFAGLGCSKPAKLEVSPNPLVLDGADAKTKLATKILDADGQEIKDGYDVVWFSDDTKHIKLATDGTVSAVSSGESTVEAEVVGTEIKVVVPVRVKIPSAVKVSHERLRLWIGQVKTDVYAEVRSEKDAWIEGYLPTWSVDDPTIVSVEAQPDPRGRYSYVKMVGLKTGVTMVNANYQGLTKAIRVAVFDENEEVLEDGTIVKKDAAKDAAPADKKKKK